MKQRNLTPAEVNEVVRELKKRGYERAKYNAKLVEFTGNGLPTLYVVNNEKDAKQYADALKENPNASVKYVFKNSVYFHPDYLNEIDKFPTLQFEAEYRRHSNLTKFPQKEGENGKLQNCGAKAIFGDAQSFAAGLDKAAELFRKARGKFFQDGRDGVVSRRTGALAAPKKEGVEGKETLNTDPNSDYHTVVTEGRQKKMFTFVHERNPQLRKQALKKFGYKCAACGFSFESFYGPELGEDFMEVHHIVPVSEGERENDYTNLRPMCSNCHRMIHRLYRELEPKDYGHAIEILTSKIKKA